MQQQWNTVQPNMNVRSGTAGNAQKTSYRISHYNYCHTCEDHVSNNHTSSTCKTPDPIHNRNATRHNMMGISTTVMHKTIMPEQCGQTARREPQENHTQGYLSWATLGFQGTKKYHNNMFKGHRQQRQQQQPACPQANMMPPYEMPNQMAPQYMAPQMMMPVPMQMPMM